MLNSDKKSKLAIAVLAVALAVTAVAKASLAPMGHDESMSFGIYNWSPYIGTTANNHPINTASMMASSIMLPESELGLRTGSIASYFILVFYTWRISALFRRRLIGLSFWLAVNGNYIVLKYAGLARGYSFALALSTAGLYYLARASVKRHDINLRDITAGALLCCLSVFSILSYACLLPCLVWNEAVNALKLKSIPATGMNLVKQSIAASARISAIGITGWWAWLKGTNLQKGGELYYGSDTIPETLSSLLTEGDTYSHAICAATTIVTGFFVLIGIRETAKTLRQRSHRPSLLSLSCIYTTLAVAGATIPPLTVGTLYPIGRTASFLIPLLYLSLFALLDEHGSRLSYMRLAPWIKSTLGMILISVLAGALWKTTAGTYTKSMKNPCREVAKTILKDSERLSRFSVGANWNWEPCLSFYRNTFPIDRLEEVQRSNAGSREYTYLLDVNGDFLGKNESSRDYYKDIELPSAARALGARLYRQKDSFD